MDAKLIHVLIVWSKGKSHLDIIIDDVSKSFNLLNIFEFSWDEKFFNENLKRFYSHSQKNKSEEAFNAIIESKLEHCGKGNFTLLIFEDLSPVFRNRKTSNGINLVNTNVFDRKAKYRKLTGGGHKIHASDNYFESNKDLALLLNTSIEDYKREYQNSSSIIKKNDNIVGVPYWKSIKDLFFILNNTIEYVVLRNFECLPSSYHIEGHGDIDLLVEDYNYIKYLTGATPIFPEDKHRVYHYLNIDNEQVPFDFRHIGDGYYDNKWELDIINNRKKNESFYFPDDLNHFYSLLYHTYIHKSKVSKDYKAKLEKLANGLKIDFNKNDSEEKDIKLLTSYLKRNGYEFSLPVDFSVLFNKKNTLSKSEMFIPNQNGKLISSTTCRTANKAFITEVYDKEKSIIKIASKPISENEYLYLSKLKDSVYFPKVYKLEQMGNYDLVEIEKINGIQLFQINHLVSFWSTKNILKLLLDAINILIELLKNDISHRDIRPDNFIIVKRKSTFSLRLIDFGWATTINESNIEPIGLGTSYKHPNLGFSDAYSMGLSIKKCLGDLNISNESIELLLSINPQDYDDKLKLEENLQSIKYQIENYNKHLSFKVSKQVLYRQIKTAIGIKRTKKIKKKYLKLKKQINFIFE